ncbi:MAG: cation-translocating P-type ATPase [Acidobacteria bacterium]|nr:cation-translocating P-type ATPase [Acidobacteriota bacterium]
MTHWYQLDAAGVLQRLGVDAARGLSPSEATRRLAEHGTNELIERRLKSPWRIWWEQLTATLVVILIVAALLSAALGDYKDTAAIISIILLNAFLGFSQEFRAEKAMAALKKLAVPVVKVRRGGHVQEVSARELVPGDIVLLEAGNLVPADCRVLESVNLRIQEAALTGESEPVNKDPEALGEVDLPLGDRRSMAYMGTVVTYGRGQAVVTDTGMDTELGRIAAMIQTVRREPTPLQRRLDQLGRRLAVVAVAIVGAIFVMGLLRGEDVKLMFLTGVSMVVAAVPEGLPAVVTIALALGAQRMLKRRALIRKLLAVETLGSVTVICSDKTGTLTENRMTVTVLDVAGHRVDLTEHLRRAVPVVEPSDERLFVLDQSALALLLTGGALCNDALLEPNDHEPGTFHTVGDPTEGALVVAAARLGLRKAELEKAFPRVAEVPFNSERRRMTTVHKIPTAATQIPAVLETVWRRGLLGGSSPYVAFAKGAVDSLLEVSGHVWIDDHAERLTGEWRERIFAVNDRLAWNGMRVLGVAFRPLGLSPVEGHGDTPERDLIFVGLVGMIDPPRPEVKDAVLTCKAAGIRPVMITGDHPLTALQIARELGIAHHGHILTGQDLARLSVGDLEDHVEEVSVYARVSPEHKLRIVQALQNRGHIVAMTGDGVNDAPALKKADIGVAMGRTGTDVSREAADMVLLDDNFATIVAAVEEGRVIYDNIRRFIRFLMTTNSAELLVMLLAPLCGMPLPLLPLQILWINLVTDGPPALALSVEPAEQGTMRRPPYRPNESIFGQRMGWHILWVGLLMSLVSLGSGYWYWRTAHPHWQTMIFTTLTLSQMGNVLAIRSGRDSLFRIGLLSNKPLLGAVALTLVLQLAVVYIPFLQGFFKTLALSAEDLALTLVLSTVVFWSVELEKWLIRRRGM